MHQLVSLPRERSWEAGTDFPQSKGLDYCNTCATVMPHEICALARKTSTVRARFLNTVRFPNPFTLRFPTWITDGRTNRRKPRSEGVAIGPEGGGVTGWNTSCSEPRAVDSAPWPELQFERSFRFVHPRRSRLPPPRSHVSRGPLPHRSWPGVRSLCGCR